jgi:branched-chain amino acid transport system permease protein
MNADIIIQIIASGLTLGAMYAVSTVGLSLVYGSLNMLNMAHGAILASGGYVTYWALERAGLPAVLAVPGAAAAGGLIGLALYVLLARPLLPRASFETSVFIATIGVGAVIENLLQAGFGPQQLPQPLTIAGGVRIGAVLVTWQNIAILATALAMMAVVGLFLRRTRTGRAIRATAQNREAAQLMGVNIGNVYALVLALSGALAAISGVLLSSLTTLSPTMGGDPMLKAFVICVVAGLGNIFGAAVAAIGIGLIEATIQYSIGVRYGFASLLVLVIVILIWRPSGLFGQRQVARM